MKLLSFVPCLLLSTSLFAQLQAVTIYSGKVKLNSIEGVRLHRNYSNKARIAINLPANTVDWYYSFTTSTDSNLIKELNTMLQVTAKIAANQNPAAAVLAHTSIGKKLISDIQIPNGQIPISAYILDNQSANLFVKNLPGAVAQPQGLSERATDAKQEVPGITSGSWCIGLQNFDTYRAAFITIEVVAIVQDNTNNNSQTQSPTTATVYGDTWTEEFKAKLAIHINTVLANVFQDPVVENEVAGCMENKTMVDNTPATFHTIMPDDWKKYDRIIFVKCMLQVFPKSPDQQKAMSFGSAGRSLYQAGDIDGCISECRQALALDNSLGWVYANLGLCYLVKNDLADAESYYSQAFTQMENQPILYEAKQQIKAAESALNAAYIKYPNLQIGPVYTMCETELAKMQAPEPALFAK